ncbi:FAD-dependent oxidoreductase [Acinetobacter populi]|nr:FAD-dependent monooxygenase [Acinetobacter populi]
MNYDTDVLVVGCGPVGILCALALAQENLKVTIIEMSPEIIPAPRAPVYFPSTIYALDKLGLLTDLENIASVGKQISQHFPILNKKVTINLNILEGLSYPYTLHIGQDKLAELGIKHAKKLGVEIQFGQKFINFEDVEDGVISTVENAEGRFDIRSKWLIGTDGASSSVREKMNIHFDGMTWPIRFVAANIHAKLYDHGYSATNFIARPEHNGVVVIIDEKTDLWRIAYSENADLDPEKVAERFEENCARPFIPEGAQYKISTLRQYRLHQRAASTFRQGHVLLAGDAAHITSPIGGLGLSGGIWDAMILADLLGAISRNEESIDILDKYSEERQRVFWEVVTPGAKENLRVIGEKNIDQHQLDCEAAQVAGNNPEIGVRVLLFSHKLIGDTLRKNSRWKDASKIKGVDMNKIDAQMGDIKNRFEEATSQIKLKETTS